MLAVLGFIEAIRRLWVYRSMTVGTMPVGGSGFVLKDSVRTDGTSYWLDARSPVNGRSIGELGRHIEVAVRHTPTGYQATVPANAVPRPVGGSSKNYVRTWVRWEPL